MSSDNGNETTDDRDESSDDGIDESIDTRSLQHAGVPTDPGVDLHTGRADTTDWLADRQLSDDESLTAFVAETSFEESVLVSLEADAPNLCYELHIDEIDVTDDSIDLAGSVRDVSEDREGCAQMETAVGQLVRVRGVGSTLSLSATIVDRDGTEYGFGTDTATDEASDATVRKSDGENCF